LRVLRGGEEKGRKRQYPKAAHSRAASNARKRSLNVEAASLRHFASDVALTNRIARCNLKVTITWSRHRVRADDDLILFYGIHERALGNRASRSTVFRCNVAMIGHWPCLSVVASGLGNIFLELFLPALKLFKRKLLPCVISVTSTAGIRSIEIPALKTY